MFVNCENLKHWLWELCFVVYISKILNQCGFGIWKEISIYIMSAYTARTSSSWLFVVLFLCWICQWYYSCVQIVLPVYPILRCDRFADVKHPKWNVITLRTYTLYTIGSETIGSHMSNIENKLLLHSECMLYIPLVQKPLVHPCQTPQINCCCTPNIYPIYHYIRNRRFAHVKHPK